MTRPVRKLEVVRPPGLQGFACRAFWMARQVRNGLQEAVSGRTHRSNTAYRLYDRMVRVEAWLQRRYEGQW